MCGVESNEGVYQCGSEFGRPWKMRHICPVKNCNSRMEPPKVGDTCYCGVYQITEEYFRECNDPLANYTVPIQHFSKCVGNVNCATTCVRNYIKVNLGCTFIPLSIKM